MGLVNPRPAMRGAEERSVRRNLEAHAIRMKELITTGMTPEAASKQALLDILGKKPRKKPGPKPGFKKSKPGSSCAADGSRVEPNPGTEDLSS